jgi:hypothetical protein
LRPMSSEKIIAIPTCTSASFCVLVALEAQPRPLYPPPIVCLQVARLMQRLTNETGFRVHGLIDAESLRQTFLDNMVPITHAKVRRAGGGRVGKARGGGGRKQPRRPVACSAFSHPMKV